MLIHSFDIGSTMPQSVEQQVLLTKYTLRHLSKYVKVRAPYIFVCKDIKIEKVLTMPATIPRKEKCILFIYYIYLKQQVY